MKTNVKEMDLPNASISRVYCYLEDKLNETEEKGILCLPSHKKKAILVTLGKLPSATGKAYTISNVRKGLNEQLGIDSKLAPCMHNIVHTYCGDINGTCHPLACERLLQQKAQ